MYIALQYEYWYLKTMCVCVIVFIDWKVKEKYPKWELIM